MDIIQNTMDFNINIDKGDSNYFIHFTTNNELEEFINYGNKFNIIIGHRCCHNKGCMVKEFNGKKINNYNELYAIHKTFQLIPK